MFRNWLNECDHLRPEWHGYKLEPDWFKKGRPNVWNLIPHNLLSWREIIYSYCFLFLLSVVLKQKKTFIPEKTSLICARMKRQSNTRATPCEAGMISFSRQDWCQISGNVFLIWIQTAFTRLKNVRVVKFESREERVVLKSPRVCLTAELSDLHSPHATVDAADCDKMTKHFSRRAQDSPFQCN